MTFYVVCCKFFIFGILIRLFSPHKVIGGLPCTFHRAFDQIANPLKDIEVLIEIGFCRVLTSGSKASAVEGSSLIKKLNDVARGKIIILAGAGVRSSNCLELVRETGVKEIHSSAKCKGTFFPELFSHGAHLGTQEDVNFIYFTSAEEVKLMKKELSNI
ncbi:Copper homeostasis protein CutC [Armadillidium nasatum]|uniref:Copper homeostasis protein cutC homolog n=1 Tax=Armadillidium nasatum TaxID=96803 RepID=A0A5N5SLG9_9CRUS|nr:Copper homeostasis protein CutC [Armadillidium nasatum]